MSISRTESEEKSFSDSTNSNSVSSNVSSIVMPDKFENEQQIKDTLNAYLTHFSSDLKIEGNIERFRSERNYVYEKYKEKSMGREGLEALATVIYVAYCNFEKPSKSQEASDRAFELWKQVYCYSESISDHNSSSGLNVEEDSVSKTITQTNLLVMRLDSAIDKMLNTAGPLIKEFIKLYHRAFPEAPIEIQDVKDEHEDKEDKEHQESKKDKKHLELEKIMGWLGCNLVQVDDDQTLEELGVLDISATSLFSANKKVPAKSAYILTPYKVYYLNRKDPQKIDIQYLGTDDSCCFESSDEKSFQFFKSLAQEMEVNAGACKRLSIDQLEKIKKTTGHDHFNSSFILKKLFKILEAYFNEVLKMENKHFLQNKPFENTLQNITDQIQMLNTKRQFAAECFQNVEYMRQNILNLELKFHLECKSKSRQKLIPKNCQEYVRSLRAFEERNKILELKMAESDKVIAEKKKDQEQLKKLESIDGLKTHIASILLAYKQPRTGCWATILKLFGIVNEQLIQNKIRIVETLENDLKEAKKSEDIQGAIVTAIEKNKKVRKEASCFLPLWFRKNEQNNRPAPASVLEKHLQECSEAIIERAKLLETYSIKPRNQH